MNNMSQTPEHQAQFSGHTLLDQHGHEVGTITDVVFDPDSETPRWGVVDPGVLKSAHYVPLVPPAYVTDQGTVVVPYDRNTILHAPKAKRVHVLSPVVERELEHHYALTE